MQVEPKGFQAATPAVAEPLDDWLNPSRFAAVLAVLLLATFGAVVFGQATFVVRDFGLFSYPVAYFQRQSFWRGELPLWNPLSLCGVPFLAQWNTMVLYPPSLLYLCSPLAWSLPFFCLVHLYWGGLGMYFLARRWTNHGLAAGVAGVLFSFNGLMLNFLMWPSHIATFSWLPWVVWLAESAWLRGGRTMVLAVLAGAMQMLAGGPETILLTWICLALLAAGDWLRLPKRRLIVLRFLSLVLLIALVCAAQLLPFLQLVSHSQRGSGYGGSAWAMPVWGWANLLVPLFRANLAPDGLSSQSGQYWTSSYYVGSGTVLLWIVAVRHWRLRPVPLLAGLIVCGLVLALGDAGWLYGFLRRSLPGLGFMRYPIKFVILVAGLAPLLAAMGLTTLDRHKAVRRRFAWGCALGLLGLIAMIILIDWDSGKAGANQAALWSGWSRAGFLLVVLLLLLAYQVASARRRILFGGLLLVAFWLDLATHVPSQNPTVSPSVYSPGWATAQRKWQPPPQLGNSRAMIAPAALENLKYHRLSDPAKTYLLDRLGLLANCNLLDEVPQVHGFFSLAPAEINDATTLPYAQTNQDFSPLLDFMGVCQISAPDNPFEWLPRPTAMPLVTAGQQPVFATDEATIQAFGRGDCDLRKVVFLPPEARNAVSAMRQTNTRVLSANFGPQSVTIQTEGDAESLVVISQAFYSCWKAEVDGHPTKLWRANLAFQCLEVTPGEHRIRLFYQDDAFRLGVLGSAAGILLCLALWLRAKPVLR